MNKLKLIIYTSDYTGQDIDKDLGLIEYNAKKKNPIFNITGVLFYHNNRFLQVIEGYEQQLNQLVLNIKKDYLHKNILILFEEFIVTKSFEKWNMDSFNLNNTDNIDQKKLILIAEVYKKNLLANGEYIIDFYKDNLKKFQLKH